MPIRDGNSWRFTADDHPVGSPQRAIAEAQARAVGGTIAPVATPTLAMILDGLPHHKAYDDRVSNAWRDP